MAVHSSTNGGRYTRTTNVPTLNSWTMMGWFFWPTVGVVSTTLYYGTSPRYAIEKSATDVLTVVNSVAGATGSTLLVNKWYHLTLVSLGSGSGQLLMYLDGKLDVTHNGNGSITAGGIQIGESGVVPNFRVAGVKIYNRALTPNQIRTEMLQISPADLRGLNSFYPFHTTSGDEVDQGPFHRDLTVTGTWTSAASPPIPWAVKPRARYGKHAAVGGGGGSTHPGWFHSRGGWF